MVNKAAQIHFGTDPEYLIVDSAGRPVPAHKAGLPGKTRKWSLKTKYGSEDGARAFRDGYMIEINIAPSHCRQTMSFRMQRALQAVKARLAPHNYSLITTPAIKIDLKKDMAKAPLDVKQFGCEPSYCAYDGTTKIPPIDAMTHPWRYAGGHLHFSPGIKGYSADGKAQYWPAWMKDPEEYAMVIRLFDQYLGLPLTCLFHSPAQYQRRRFYGQAGEYRPQVYKNGKPGLEYRTPGPEIWNLPWLSSIALDIGRYIVENKADLVKKYNPTRGAAVRHAINTGENRWKLLQELPGQSLYSPALWRRLYMFRPVTSTPDMLITADDTTIRNGFGDWWREKGKKR